MGKQIYFSDKDAERLYHHLRNELETSDLSEDDEKWYKKMMAKLTGRNE